MDTKTKFKIKLPFMKKSAAAKASAGAHKLRLGKDPYFDWTVILAMFIATAVLCVSFGFALWHSISGESFDSSSVSSGPTLTGPSLDAVGLKKILSIEAQKSLIASQYSAGYPGPADPSK
jgi:hypothetical protein